MQNLTCSSLGMMPNSKDDASSNYIKLATALSKGDSICVDNIYYIQTDKPTKLFNSINIKGINNSKIIIMDGNTTTYFILSSLRIINLNDVCFEYIGNTYKLLFLCNNNIFIDTVNISNCVFNGNIYLLKYSADTTINPNVVKYGIKKFYFSNNNINNNRSSFIVLMDVPHDIINISGNTINNFDNVFLNSGITNNHVFKSEIELNKKILLCQNNIVICDDNWWSINTGNTGCYYSFINFEGNYCRYINNHVEGMKNTSGSVELYDLYFNGFYLDYINNFYKNNICFDVNKLTPSLIKAKQCINGRGIRYCEGNTFIIEESLAEKFKKPLDSLWCSLYEAVSPMDLCIIRDNNIDVYKLVPQTTSADIIEVHIINNNIKARIIQNTFIHQKIMSNKEDYIGRNIIFSGNIITSDTYGENATYLISQKDMSDSTKDIVVENIIIENNIINVPVCYLTGEIKSKNIDIKNNLIKLTDIHDINNSNFIKLTK